MRTNLFQLGYLWTSEDNVKSIFILCKTIIRYIPNTKYYFIKKRPNQSFNLDIVNFKASYLNNCLFHSSTKHLLFMPQIVLHRKLLWTVLLEAWLVDLKRKDTRWCYLKNVVTCSNHPGLWLAEISLTSSTE
jgi:hypothetical protein